MPHEFLKSKFFHSFLQLIFSLAVYIYDMDFVCIYRSSECKTPKSGFVSESHLIETIHYSDIYSIPSLD